MNMLQPNPPVPIRASRKDRQRPSLARHLTEALAGLEAEQLPCVIATIEQEWQRLVPSWPPSASATQKEPKALGALVRSLGWGHLLDALQRFPIARPELLRQAARPAPGTDESVRVWFRCLFDAEVRMHPAPRAKTCGNTGSPPRAGVQIHLRRGAVAPDPQVVGAVLRALMPAHVVIDGGDVRISAEA